MGARDQAKIAVYLSLSLAARYNDRVSFKFEDFAESLKFEGAAVRSLLASEKLRLLEYEILSKLNFMVGDSASETAG